MNPQNDVKSSQFLILPRLTISATPFGISQPCISAAPEFPSFTPWPAQHLCRGQHVLRHRAFNRIVPDVIHLSLLLSAPDALQETITLCQPVEGVVALAHRADEAAEGVDLVLAGVSAVLVDLSDGDLDGCVILGLDDAVGCAALAGDQTVEKTTLAYPVTSGSNSTAGNWRIERESKRGGEDEQVNEFSLIVLHVCDVKVLM